MTTDQQTSRINQVLYAIHRDIAADLSARRLAGIAAWSEQHFHRVFARVTGESVHRYVLRTRLEHAANQLTFDRQSPVLDIAQKCGFNSLSSFTHAFNKEFGTTPGRWRQDKPGLSQMAWQDDPEIAAAYDRIAPKALPRPRIENTDPLRVAYVRHTGYGRDIAAAWELLSGWAQFENRPFDLQLGLHHSNPSFVPLRQCRYVACVAIDRPVIRRGRINSLVIPGGLHARFPLIGQYGELLPWISKILADWLPESGFKARTTPAFVRYRRNQFLEPDEHFDLDFFLPLTLV